MAYAYRQLESSDLPQMKALLRVFAEAFDDFGSYQAHVPNDSYLQALLSRPQFIVIVALQGEEVVGGLAAYVLEKFEQERSEIYIYDLAVAPSHRRQGVATSLIRHLQSIARTRGAWVIFVQADAGDTPAIRLYESLGRKEDVHHFDITVP